MGEKPAELVEVLLQSHRTQPHGHTRFTCRESKAHLAHLGMKERREKRGRNGMIARTARTLILSTIAFGVVTLLVSLGVQWATGGVSRGALVGMSSGTVAAFAIGAVGTAAGRPRERSRDRKVRWQAGSMKRHVAFRSRT